MIIVTGGAGFIGSNVVRALNARGRNDIIVVDDRPEGAAAANLAGLQFAEYLHKDALMARLQDWSMEAVIHLGACAVTTEDDEAFLIRNNFEYSVRLLEAVRKRSDCPFVYASSAAVYGAGTCFREEPACEAPLNGYARSKKLFDDHVRRTNPTGVVGLRYFNVYGPGEAHKGAMASLVRQWDVRIRAGGTIRLFRASHGVAAGEQRRDFLHVDDAVHATLWFAERRLAGIFNVGTGTSRTFNELAGLVQAHHRAATVEYVPFPDALAGRYQARTEADLSRLRAAGCPVRFRSIEEGVPAYLASLSRESARAAAPSHP